jgi:hypothetical protein
MVAIKFKFRWLATWRELDFPDQDVVLLKDFCLKLCSLFRWKSYSVFVSETGCRLVDLEQYLPTNQTFIVERVDQRREQQRPVMIGTTTTFAGHKRISEPAELKLTIKPTISDLEDFGPEIFATPAAAAEVQVVQLQTTPVAPQVKSVITRAQIRALLTKSFKCPVCGEPGHPPSSCPYKKTKRARLSSR